MKKQISSIIGCLLLMAGLSFGDITLTYDDLGAGGGTASSGSYTPGQSFTFNISLGITTTGNTGPLGDAVPNATGYSVWFETAAVNNSYFTITNRTLGATFTDPNSPDLWYPQQVALGGNFPVNPVPPENDQSDLGASRSFSVASNATYALGSLSIGIAANTPAGTYTIANTFGTSPTTKRTAVADSSFASHMATQGFAYTITVVPEPATWSLMGLGGMGALGLTWLRARRRSS